ncbi:MAG: patatin-like phospholipase family protein [Bacteroidia bacterium]|nr:patatin-like phospholipase family protein [Bacteroidia bacterium]
MEKKRIDLALQGGGSHGAFTWGVIDRLLDDDRIQIDGICGTSAGAMNGVVTSYGLMKGGTKLAKHLLVKLWFKISEAGKFSPLQPTLLDKMVSKGNMDFSPGYKLFSLTTETLSPAQFNPFGFNPLEKILNSLIDFDELHKLQPPRLFVCATNVLTCEPKVFGPDEITLKSILASACLPYMYHAVEINGEYFWDGGFMGNPPLWPLIEHTENTDDILLIQINPIRIHKVPQTVEEIKDRINEISFNSSLIHELKYIKLKQEVLKKNNIKNHAFHEIRIHNIKSENYLNDLNLSSKLNTSWDFLMHLKEQGYKACQDWLDKNFDRLGKEWTLEL